MQCQGFSEASCSSYSDATELAIFPQTAECTTKIHVPVSTLIIPMCMFRRMRIYGYTRRVRSPRTCILNEPESELYEQIVP